MLLDYFLPSPALQDYVRNFHIAHFVFGEKEIIPVKAYTPWRLYPIFCSGS